MDNIGAIKRYIIIGLVVIEGFVWTISSPIDAWSFGAVGAADGPNLIFDSTSREAIEAEIDGKEAEQAGQSGKEEEQREKEEAEKVENDKIRISRLEAAESKGLFLLVNKENPIDKDYAPSDLTEIKYYAPDRVASSRYMVAEAAESFNTLVEGALEENIEILMTTAYRSYEFQELLYNNYVKNEGQEAADKFSAQPGKSEHQTGLSVDVSSASVDYKLTNGFGETKEGKWLAENAHKYGFIIRFPEGKEEITGYIYEPWHIRYVGEQAAKEIYENQITLEEFLSDYYK